MKWFELSEKFTPEMAQYVRELRCGDISHTWRAVAEKCAQKYEGDWGSNQIAGMESILTLQPSL